MLFAAATVTGKFYTRGVCDGDGGASERRAQHRIRDLFALGPRERLAAPCTESQRYYYYLRHCAPLCL